MKNGEAIATPNCISAKNMEKRTAFECRSRRHQSAPTGVSSAATWPPGSVMRERWYTEMTRAAAAVRNKNMKPASVWPALLQACSSRPPIMTAQKEVRDTTRVLSAKKRPRRRSGTMSPIRLLHCGAANCAPLW